jgi:pantoate--beta-alanine ligase
MKIIDTLGAAHEHARVRTAAPAVLVPTMGALHRGHIELVRVARERAGTDGEVAASIFVNPLQFEPGSDFDKYPRPRAADEKVCADASVDVLFRPSANDMYAEDNSIVVEETKLSSALCGASRPGHFRGVCTVVAKLFHLLQPDIAVFGEKDYQQLVIMRRMVRDLNFPIEIVGVPTVREPDGLALSSRNQYLSATERADASVLRRAAVATSHLVARGETSTHALLAAARGVIETAASARIDYISIVDADNLEPLTTVHPRAVLTLAVFVGKTRLIDNLRLT